MFVYLTLSHQVQPVINGVTTTQQTSLPAFLDPNTNGGINIFAGLLQLGCIIFLLQGVDVSKVTINFFTVFKLILIAFMIVMGFAHFEPANLVPFAPFGFMGIMKGATSCIFGLLGYDEVCCLAAEAQNPHKNLPIAVFGTILVVSVFYCLAALALVGLQASPFISPDSGFTVAFQSHNLHWVAQAVALGELICLPVVVLICFLAQPRFV
jgi:amino acid transporter